MKITMLGTGNAMVTECYNTCFVISCRESHKQSHEKSYEKVHEESHGERHFLVDGGGGNAIFRQLKSAGYDWMDMKEIFVTHKHIDHILGIIWLVRAVCQSMGQGNYEGEVNIYAHDEVIGLIKDLTDQLLWEKQTRSIGKRIHLITVQDKETREINGSKVTFFDIQSSKDKQFGFSMELSGKERLTCCGDEPYNECEKEYVQGSKWLLHEAFCLSSQADIFKPYEKHHSTVKDVCELAEGLGVQNLILYHTEDKNIQNRKEMYYEEGSRYFHGALYIPEDLESIPL